jgi:hypothetical protein
MFWKQKSSHSVVICLDTPDYFINWLLFLLLEDVHERSLSLTLMMCSWMDWRDQIYVRILPWISLVWNG